MKRSKQKTDWCGVCQEDRLKKELYPSQIKMLDNPGRIIYMKICKSCYDSFRHFINPTKTQLENVEVSNPDNPDYID